MVPEHPLTAAMKTRQVQRTRLGGWMAHPCPLHRASTVRPPSRRRFARVNALKLTVAPRNSEGLSFRKAESRNCVRSADSPKRGQATFAELSFVKLCFKWIDWV